MPAQLTLAQLQLRLICSLQLSHHPTTSPPRVPQNEIMADLPPALREDVAQHLSAEMVKTVPLFWSATRECVPLVQQSTLTLT